MPESRWICNVCRTSHATEETATDCENSHPAMENFRIKQIIYRTLDGLYGPPLACVRAVPHKIRVECPSIYGHDHATYVLDHIGCKSL